MSRGFILYNVKAGAETNEEKAKMFTASLEGELNFVNISEIEDYNNFFLNLSEEDFIVLCGGDGTLNRFINDTEGIEFSNAVLYYPCGSGNDFATDVGRKLATEPFEISKYIKDLPFVTVNGKKYRFINGVGYGIDGYCCEEGDKLKTRGQKKINYASIAITGLLFHYKPTSAKILVDGVSYSFDKVWLAPTMFGRYYGGGMMPTPAQNREAEEQSLSTLVFHGSGKLKSLLMFPSLFKGEHIKYKNNIKILSGKEITVEFDRPVALQIDGETISGVTSYTACTSVKVKA